MPTWLLWVGGAIAAYVGYKVIVNAAAVSAASQNANASSTPSTTYVPSPVFTPGGSSVDTSGSTSATTTATTTSDSTSTSLLTADTLNTLALNQQAQNYALSDKTLNNTQQSTVMTLGGMLTNALQAMTPAPTGATGVSASFTPDSSGGFTENTNFNISNSLVDLTSQLNTLKSSTDNTIAGLNTQLSAASTTNTNLTGQLSQVQASDQSTISQLTSSNNSLQAQANTQSSLASQYQSLANGFASALGTLAPTFSSQFKAQVAAIHA